MASLSNLTPNIGATKKSKVVGRGNGSGHGKTSCRGSNGQRSRSGASRSKIFEGGQMPLNRRVPKVGFFNRFRTEFSSVNLNRLEGKLEGVKVVDLDFLLKNGFVKKADLPVKILGNGDITNAPVFKVNAVSKSAKEKIEKAGGKIELV